MEIMRMAYMLLMVSHREHLPKGQYMFKHKILTALCLASISMAGTAHAASVYSGSHVDMYLKSNTFPSGLSEERVYLDSALSSNVTGHVGTQTNSRVINFSSTTDVLDAANGYANIKAQDGYLNSLTITAPSYLFDNLIFSVNLVSNSNKDLSVTVKDKFGSTESFTGWPTLGSWVNGENRILVHSKNDDLMQSVTISSTTGFVLKQTQISGLTDVPIPAAAWLFGSSLLGLAGMKRRKAKTI
jgi:hypothetical protein